MLTNPTVDTRKIFTNGFEAREVVLCQRSSRGLLSHREEFLAGAVLSTIGDPVRYEMWARSLAADRLQ